MFFRPLSLVLTGSLLGLAASASAQMRVSAGLQTGLNTSWANYDPNSQRAYQRYAADITPRTGVSAGLTALLYGTHVAVQPTVSLTTTRFHVLETTTTLENGGIVTSSYQTAYNFVYLHLPVDMIYFFKSPKRGIHVSIGGYAGLLLGGKVARNNHFQTNQSAFEYTAEGIISAAVGDQFSADNFYAKPFSAGLRGGVGYKLNQLLVQAHYQVGLLDLSKANSTTIAPTIEPRSVEVALSYLLFTKMSN